MHGGLAGTLGRRLAIPRGLDDAALARIDGPVGQARLAMAPAPLARWQEREAEEVLLGAVGLDGRLTGVGVRRRSRRDSLGVRPHVMVWAPKPGLHCLSAGSGDAPVSPHWRVRGGGLAMRRPRCVTAWAPTRRRPRTKRKSSAVGERRRKPPAAPEPGLTGPKPLPEGEAQTMEGRAAHAAEAWHELCCGGAPWVSRTGPLPENTPDRVTQVFARLRAGKAKGAGG